MKLIERYEKLKPDFDIEKCPESSEIRDVLRVNTLKMSEEKCINRLKELGVKLRKVKFLPNAYKYESEFSLASTTEYALGYFYLQEAASQIPALILDPDESNVILDMCSAPGSKTTQLSQLMNNRGVIFAFDNSSGRLKALKSNLLRCGCKNIISYNKDSRYISNYNIKFDKILLDAPCSGNFAIDPEFFEKRTVLSFRDRAILQKELLKEAYKVLEEKGSLIYSTCSLEPEENEEVIEWFIKKYDDMYIEKIDLKIPNMSKGLTKVFDKELSPELEKCMRIWPDSGMQGFFVCSLKKK